MGKVTIIKVERIINASLPKVKELLLDLKSYPLWWSCYHLKLNTAYDSLTFQPLPFIVLQLDLIDRGADFIKFGYTKGPIRGHGIWELKELSTNKIFISNTIEISGKNIVFGFFSSSSLFELSHKRVINKLISKMERSGVV